MNEKMIMSCHVMSCHVISLLLFQNLRDPEFSKPECRESKLNPEVLLHLSHATRGDTAPVDCLLPRTSAMLNVFVVVGMGLNSAGRTDQKDWPRSVKRYSPNIWCILVCSHEDYVSHMEKNAMNDPCFSYCGDPTGCVQCC